MQSDGFTAALEMSSSREPRLIDKAVSTGNISSYVVRLY